jgi:hypothetical protein
MKSFIEKGAIEPTKEPQIEPMMSTRGRRTNDSLWSVGLLDNGAVNLTPGQRLASTQRRRGAKPHSEQMCGDQPGQQVHLRATRMSIVQC